MNKESAVENTQQPIKGFKGFNRDMKCRGFQFEEGKTYKHDGDVEACSSGFHFCENPLDVFSYYSPGESVFREVEGSGESSRHSDDSKIAVSEIKIGVELSLHNFIASGIKFLFERKYTESESSHSTGDRSAASVTGHHSAASVTGDRSAASVTGYQSAASVTGDQSAASVTGDQSAASVTGNCSSAACTGLNGKAMCGPFGCISLQWWNGKEQRGEMRCAEIGCGDGSDGKLKASTWYSLDENGCFVEV